MKAACSKPHKHASSKACAEHMHRWLLQSASWHLAKLCSAHFQQHPSHNKMLDLACDIRNELTNAVQTTFTKAGVVHTKVSCVRDMYAKKCKAAVLKLLSNPGSCLCRFFVYLVQKILQHQIRMPAVSLATLRTGIYKICFYCKLYLTYHG